MYFSSLTSKRSLVTKIRIFLLFIIAFLNETDFNCPGIESLQGTKARSPWTSFMCRRILSINQFHRTVLSLCRMNTSYVYSFTFFSAFLSSWLSSVSSVACVLLVSLESIREEILWNLAAARHPRKLYEHNAYKSIPVKLCTISDMTYATVASSHSSSSRSNPSTEATFSSNSVK